MIEINKTGMCIGCDQARMEVETTEVRNILSGKIESVQTEVKCIHEAACKRICRIVKEENNAETD